MDNSASNRRLAVSTECPTCSAPLDFSEGSNAIRCGHCRSNLLVTGRGQILSYAIEPRTPEGQARNHLRSLFREPGARVSEPKLFFVPFYRVTGHEFVWRKEAPKPKVERSLSELSGDTSRELEWGGWGGGGGYERFTLAGLIVDGVSALIDRLTSVGEPVGLPELEKRETSKAQPLPPPVSPRGEPIEFNHRHIEKNFVASESEGLGIYSLGVRSAVLKLALFDAAALAQIGSLLPVMLDPATATERGLMGGDKDVLVRRTAGVIVSLIYFPFWLAKIDGAKGERLVALDGVTGGIASREVSPSLLASAGSGSGTAAVVAGFRPLVCPNCGWDLNVSPDDVIFFCRTCRRAWKIEKDTLMPASYEIASIAHVTVGDRGFGRRAGKNLGACVPIPAAPASGDARLKALADEAGVLEYRGASCERSWSSLRRAGWCGARRVPSGGTRSRRLRRGRPAYASVGSFRSSRSLSVRSIHRE